MAPDGSDARDVALLNLALFEGGVVEGPEVADIRLVDVDVAQANAARTAFSRYGKGRATPPS